jgi:hypothetical protein
MMDTKPLLGGEGEGHMHQRPSTRGGLDLAGLKAQMATCVIGPSSDSTLAFYSNLSSGVASGGVGSTGSSPRTSVDHEGPVSLESLGSQLAQMKKQEKEKEQQQQEGKEKEAEKDTPVGSPKGSPVLPGKVESAPAALSKKSKKSKNKKKKEAKAAAQQQRQQTPFPGIPLHTEERNTIDASSPSLTSSDEELALSPEGSPKRTNRSSTFSLFRNKDGAFRSPPLPTVSSFRNSPRLSPLSFSASSRSLRSLYGASHSSNTDISPILPSDAQAAAAGRDAYEKGQKKEGNKSLAAFKGSLSAMKKKNKIPKNDAEDEKNTMALYGNLSAGSAVLRPDEAADAESDDENRTDDKEEVRPRRAKSYGDFTKSKTVNRLKGYRLSRRFAEVPIAPADRRVSDEVLNARLPAVELFGASLEDLMKLQATAKPENVETQAELAALEVPLILVHLAYAIVQSGGCTREGLFRVPGTKATVDRLKVSLCSGEYEDLSLENPHDLASLMKEWLKSLKDPVIPRDLYQRCMDTVVKPKDSVAIVDEIPYPQQAVLRYVISFLQHEILKPEVQKVTRMDMRSIAMTFAPCLMDYDESDMQKMMANIQLQIKFLVNLLMLMNVDGLESTLDTSVSSISSVRPQPQQQKKRGPGRPFIFRFTPSNLLGRQNQQTNNNKNK